MVHSTRRQLLLAALASGLRAQKNTPFSLDRGFARVATIAPDVYATIADPSKGEQCASNGGIIAGRDAVLIVEGHMQPAGASFEIEVARMVSKIPLRGAVNTHYHLDHTFGNAAYEESSIPILAHAQVAPLMKERYAAFKGKEKQPLLAPAEKRLREAVDAEDRKRKQQDLGSWKWMCDAIDSTILAYPTESFTAAQLPKRIELGGITAILEFLPGHTSTDLIVHVPERDIVFAGDLLFHRAYPVSIDADMASWRKAYDRLASFGRNTKFVPGHGPVCGQDNVREQAALCDDLRAHAEKMKKSGASAEEAERRYTAPARFKDYSVHSWGLTIGAAMQSFYREKQA